MLTFLLRLSDVRPDLPCLIATLFIHVCKAQELAPACKAEHFALWSTALGNEKQQVHIYYTTKR